MSSWFSDKKIYVTGAKGFLGKEVVKQLFENDGCKQLFIPSRSAYDLRIEHDVRRALIYYKPDIIIHLAGKVGGIGECKSHPGEFFYDNLMMGTNILEQARLEKISKVVMINSVCAYPKFTPAPFKEEDLWLGYPEETNGPYGMSKKMAIVQSQAYRQQYNFNSINLLLVNLFGEGDNFNLDTSHVIPALIRKCLDAKQNNKPYIEVWGTGGASREFIHVSDAARAILLATEKYDSSDPVNIGTGQSILVSELVKLVAELTGFAGEFVYNHAYPDGQPIRQLDVSKAKEYFGFEAQIGFKEGLRRTINWYVKNSTESKSLKK